ncbi:ZZ-type zinc finger-containing protein 3 [Onthophagus taurus]|uniref:ZZ-type zinc finger-containing protein 3 n=1 Tax=Onthophagus taurus TaxID=166361 RepID=UPI0039BE2217
MNEKNDNEEDELFYFESDHLALKGNADYSELLKIMFVLEAQRKRAIDDYKKVVDLQKEYESNPVEMIEKMQRGENLDIPDMQVIIDVPKINWEKFDVKVPENLLAIINSIDGKDGGVKAEDLNHQKPTNTHSKPWTVEEQKRLEELLITYPPEDIELRRYKKIAAALGTRTVQQVCSRIQKYFLKLKKAGLPIPGRIPKLVLRKSPKIPHGNCNIKPSTFFPELNIPVTMNELEEVPGASQSSYSNEQIPHINSSNYLLSTGYQQEKLIENVRDENEIQLKILKLIKEEKKCEDDEDACLFQHVGYKCDYCEEEPISGSRWHCTTCQTSSVDYCTDCMLTQMYSATKHPLSHKFSIVRDGEHNISIEYDKNEITSEFDDNDKMSGLSSDIDSDELDEFMKDKPPEKRSNGLFIDNDVG